MPEHEIFKEHDLEDCFYSCRTVHDFMRLTDEMVHTIIGLEEELVRWRQALIKYPSARMGRRAAVRHFKQHRPRF